MCQSVFMTLLSVPEGVTTVTVTASTHFCSGLSKMNGPTRRTGEVTWLKIMVILGGLLLLLLLLLRYMYPNTTLARLVSSRRQQHPAGKPVNGVRDDDDGCGLLSRGPFEGKQAFVSSSPLSPPYLANSQCIELGVHI